MLKKTLLLVGLLGLTLSTQAKTEQKYIKRTGLASWHDYSNDRTVKRKYRNTMIAASREYPCGSLIKVFNWGDKYKRHMKHPRWVVVQIQDFGPAAYTNRVLDLNKPAFRKIASIDSGEVKVVYILLKRGGKCVHRH